MNSFFIIALVVLVLCIIFLVFVMIFRKRIIIKKIHRDSAKGSVSAQLALVGYYFSPETKDVEQGLFWLKKAAENGSAEAQAALGTVYGEGKILPRNQEESIKWFLSAAMNGDTFAQKTMAGIYHFSVGLDKKIAYAWYQTAATKNDTHSREMSEKLAIEFNNEERAEAKELATEYIKKYNTNKN